MKMKWGDQRESDLPIELSNPARRALEEVRKVIRMV